MSKRSLRPEEQRAWARVARSIRAMPGHSDMPPAPDVLSASKARNRPPDGVVTGSPAGGQAPLPSGGVANRQGERKVRRGRMPVSATLDLHGHSQASAHGLLVGFLARERSATARCVLVITGKGRDGEGVLRRRFLQWLDTAEASGLVSGFAPAHRKHGGAGAWYVFLRKL